MKILVTGGSGFIGSNFILQQINSHNNQIINFDNLTYAGNLENLNSVSKNPNYEFVKGDICDMKAFSNILNKNKPDTVIHFAAESHVDRSIDSPMQFIHTNIVGTATILNCILEYLNHAPNNNFRFLHVSTDEVYGSLGKDDFFVEETPYNPSSPYSSSKASSDHLVRAWQRTYDFPAIITNCSNNYGPYQFPEKLIPLIIANCIDEKPLPIYGDGSNIRDWLFVEDHCKALHTTLKKGVLGETYNIGGNNEVKNIDIVKQICLLLDKERPRKNNDSYSDLITFVKDRPGHDFRYAIDSTKIKNDLSWEPTETFDSGLKKTIEWYLNNEKWWRNIQDISYRQQRLGLSTS